MGKRLITQRRGKGSPRYKSPSHRYFGEIRYPIKSKEILQGEVIDIVNSVGHSAPLMIVKYEDDQMCLLPAPMGIKVGQTVFYGGKDSSVGNAIALKDIPIGARVFNIEKVPGQNGKLLRAAGASGILVAKEKKNIVIKMPSKRQIKLNPECYASLGVVAGVGVKNKPLIKAGNSYHKRKAKNKLVSKVKGVAMNAVDHPHGGTHRRHRPTSTTVRRKGRSPGQKVGMLSAKKSGRGK